MNSIPAIPCIRLIPRRSGLRKKRIVMPSGCITKMREIAYGSDQPHPLHYSVEEYLLHLKANENQQTESLHYLVNYDG